MMQTTGMLQYSVMAHVKDGYIDDVLVYVRKASKFLSHLTLFIVVPIVCYTVKLVKYIT